MTTSNNLRAYWSYQQYFLNWLSENRHLLKFQPRNLRTTVGYVAFGLEGVSSLLRIEVFDSRVRVGLFWWGRHLDSLLEFSCKPKQFENGMWTCERCELIYPTLEALLRELLYLPLMIWLNNEMSNCNQIEIAQGKKGWVTAKLYPYSYYTPSIHFEDFMDQLEMKFELANQNPFAGPNIETFFYAPLFDEPDEIDKFINKSLLDDYFEKHQIGDL